jgi:hypothetical protein
MDSICSLPIYSDSESDVEQEIKTFVDLFEFLQETKDACIFSWLSEPWSGKDKQESLLRLFAGLGLIDKLKDFQVAKGNFNSKTINYPFV